MSVVTGVVLCASCSEPDGSEGEDGPAAWIETVNAWLSERSEAWLLTPVENRFGGGKHPQMNVAGGGFNHFPEDDFLTFLRTLKWESPENVILVMQPEDGATIVWRP